MYAFDKQFQRVVLSLMADLNTPLSLKVAKLVEYGEYGQLFAMKIDPTHYFSSEDYFRDCQAVELLRKLDLPEDLDRLNRAAEQTFRECERQCAETNLRLNSQIHMVYDHVQDLAIREFLLNCKKFAKDVLGPLPRWLECKFGPGATFNDTGSLTTIPDKMSSQPTITADAWDLLPLVRDTAWFRALYARNNSISTPKVVPGNRFTTVPKDATKRRGICIEPSINLSLQLAVGRAMKQRLLRIGIDLRNGQKQVHRAMARAASLSGDYATIDLSNASDTVAYSLVKLILPSDWFDLLDSLRSPTTKIDGLNWKLNKFSSMGNGFTFELETLIFCALMHGVGGFPGANCFAYGDDLIVPTHLVNDLLPCLTYFGFTPNQRKTFVSGHFRESCGGDYFDGTAVRPHYIKELPREPQDWIKLANGLRRAAKSSPQHPGRWDLYRRAWHKCLDALPTHIRRLTGPEELGDLVINDDSWQTEWEHSIGRVRIYKPITNPLPWHHWWPEVQLASALYGVPSEGPIPRSNVAGYRVCWAYFS